MHLSLPTLVICLGTPHDGAPLERVGKTVDLALGLSRFSSPWAVIGKIRSVAIQQLGHAAIPVWTTRPSGLRLHAVAGVWRSSHRGGLSAALGDGLVPMASALGESAASRAAGFDHRHVVTRVGHLALVRHPDVLDHLVRILT